MDTRPSKRHVANAEGWRRLWEHFDGSACVSCWRRATQLHHLQFRSQGGWDVAENLCPLCAVCHERVHRRDEKALSAVRAYIDSLPETLDWLIDHKGWDWLNRVYPK